MADDTGSARSHSDSLDFASMSQREIAQALGISTVTLWRWKLLATIPEDVFEELIEADKVPTIRELANTARRYRGDIIPEDYEHCPSCGEPTRKRS